MQTFKAIQRNARISPRKARLSAELIRGKRVEDALNILAFEHRRGSTMLRKVIESAVANAANVGGIDPMDLSITDARVDNSFIITRIRPQARGRAHRRYKRCSHISVAVGVKPAAQPAEKKAKS
jgi:large subunit ribosomal protein L22